MMPVLYVKTPKTGGTSFLKMMTDLLGEPVNIDGQSRQWPSMSRLSKAPFLSIGDVAAKKFRRKFPAIWNNALRVAIVRNPYTKTISAWRYCRSTKNLSLEKAIGSKLPKKSWWKRYSHDYVHLTLSQSSFLVDNGKVIVPHVIQFESLQKGANSFLREIGERPVELPNLNVAKRPANPATCLSATAIARINNLFACDFKAFGYEMLSASHEAPPRIPDKECSENVG